MKYSHLFISISLVIVALLNPTKAAGGLKKHSAKTLQILTNKLGAGLTNILFSSKMPSSISEVLSQSGSWFLTHKKFQNAKNKLKKYIRKHPTKDAKKWSKNNSKHFKKSSEALSKNSYQRLKKRISDEDKLWAFFRQLKQKQYISSMRNFFWDIFHNKNPGGKDVSILIKWYKRI